MRQFTGIISVVGGQAFLQINTTTGVTQALLLKGPGPKATFSLTSGEITSVQQIVLQKDGGQAVALAMPKPDPPRPSLKAHDPVPLKTPAITLSGTLLGGLQTVTSEKETLVAKVADDGNSVVVMLPDALTADPHVLQLSFMFKDNTVLSYNLAVSR